MKTTSLPNFLKASMLVLSMVIITISSCKKEDETDGGGTNDTPGAIQGAPGNPRFNLQFTNGRLKPILICMLKPQMAI